jgi:hypothetical protein
VVPKPATKAAAKPDIDANGDAAGQKADQAATTKPHHSSTTATGTGDAASGDAAASGTARPAVAKPKAPKPPSTDQPPPAPEPSAEPPANSGNGSPPQ